MRHFKICPWLKMFKVLCKWNLHIVLNFLAFIFLRVKIRIRVWIFSKIFISTIFFQTRYSRCGLRNISGHDAQIHRPPHLRLHRIRKCVTRRSRDFPGKIPDFKTSHFNYNYTEKFQKSNQWPIVIIIILCHDRLYSIQNNSKNYKALKDRCCLCSSL